MQRPTRNTATTSSAAGGNRTTTSSGVGTTTTRKPQQQSTTMASRSSRTTNNSKMDDELNALRQRMAIPMPTSLAIANENKRNPDGQSNIPATRLAPSSAPSGGQQQGGGVDAWVAGQQEQHSGGGVATSTAMVSSATNRQQQPQSILNTIGGGGGASLLFAGSFNKDTLSTINSRSFPTTSAPEIGDQHIQKHDILRYLRRQTTDFEESMSVINDFTYDEDHERLRKGDPTPTYNDPFVFVKTSGGGVAGGEGATAAGGEEFSTPTKKAPGAGAGGSLSNTPHKPASPAPTWNGGRGPAAPSTGGGGKRGGAGGGSVTTATERHGFSNDIYNVDSAFGKAESVKPAALKKGPTLTTSALSTHQKSVTSSSSGAKTTAKPAVADQLRCVKYRPKNVVMKHIDRGLVRFCQSCSKVVLGEGEGACPHCGAEVRLPEGDGGGAGHHHEHELADTAVGEDGCESSPNKNNQRHLENAMMSVEEIEADEARKFREAVASWRTAAGADEEEDQQFLLAKRRKEAEVEEQVYREQQRQEHMQVAVTKRFQYFQHLWSEMQTVLDQQQHQL